MYQCEICHGETERVFRHHVVPRLKGGRKEGTIDTCATCSQQVHMLFTEAELAAMSLEELLAREEIRGYISWKRKHPGDYGHKMSKRVRKWKYGH